MEVRNVEINSDIGVHRFNEIAEVNKPYIRVNCFHNTK